MLELASVPVRRRDVSTADVDSNMLVYAADSEQAFSMNPSAWAIFELCDGTRSVAEIGQVLADELGRPADELLADVRTALTQMHGANLIELRA